MFIDNFYQKIENRPKLRKLILIIIDSIIFFLIPNLSFNFIRNSETPNILVNLVFLIVGLFVFIFTGHYQSILRYASSIYFLD